jgi:hypothetical protein
MVMTDMWDSSGGIVGEYYTSLLAALSVSMLRCYFNGSIAGAATGDEIGGIAGLAYDVNIKQCCSLGAVSGRYNIGGFIGDNGAYIENCYAIGSVTGNDTVAGFAGRHWDNSINYSYASGAVIGSSTLGGFVGTDLGTGAPVNDGYWDKDTTGQSTSDGGTSKGHGEMIGKRGAMYRAAGWDFAATWAMPLARNNSYPYLVGVTPLCWRAGGNMLTEQYSKQHMEAISV